MPANDSGLLGAVDGATTVGGSKSWSDPMDEVSVKYSAEAAVTAVPRL